MPIKHFITRMVYRKPSLEYLGWYSMALFLLAYSLVSVGTINGDSLTYHMLNLVGASGYAIYAHRRKVYPSVFANVVWAGIGVYAIFSIVL